MQVPVERRMPWAILLGRVGGAVRGRVSYDGEEVSLECDLRFRYRGINPIAVMMICVLAGGALFAFLAVLRFR